MSAIVCGKRSAFDDSRSAVFEESTVDSFHPATTTADSFHATNIYVPLPPVTKRPRYQQQPSSSPSPRYAWGQVAGGFSAGGAERGASVEEKLVLLRSMFGGVEEQVVHQVLEACNHDIDSAIQSLQGLRIIAADTPAAAANQHSPTAGQAQPLQGPLAEAPPAQAAAAASTPEAAAAHAAQAAIAAAGAGGGVGAGVGGGEGGGGGGVGGEGDGAPSNGAEWVDLVVREMMSAVDVADVRQKAATVLELFEKEVRKRCEAAAAAAAAAGAASELPQQIPASQLPAQMQAAQQQMAALARENAILKRAVAIQHERQREHHTREEELGQLRQAVAQYQDQLRKLEVSNYALSLHLQKAQGTATIPNRFHPDVF